MPNLKELYVQMKDLIIRKSAYKRANDLHHFYVMSGQTDVPFPLLERIVLRARIWCLGRILLASHGYSKWNVPEM